MSTIFEVYIGKKRLEVKVKDGTKIPAGVPAAVSKRVKQVGSAPFDTNARVVILIRSDNDSLATFGNLVIVWGNDSTYTVSFCLKNGFWRQTKYQRVAFGPIQIQRL